MKKNIIYALIVVVIAAGVIFIGSKGLKKDATQVAAVTNTISVTVQKAQAAEKSTGMIYKADIEPYEEGIVSSKSAGKVLNVLFENGKKVSKGEPLIVLDPQDLNNQLKTTENQLKLAKNQLVTSEISLQKIDTSLANAKRDYDRAKALFNQGAVSKQEFENFETALKMAQTDFESSKASIDTLKITIEASEINIENLKDSLANTVIKSPINGVMDEKGVNIGQFVSPGDILAKVKNISDIYAVIQVKQENMNKVELGQKALIRLEGFGDTAFEGTVTSKDVSADLSARTFKCKIRVKNDQQQLHPGIFAKAELVSSEKVKVVTVPIEALAGNEGNYYLYVNDNGIAHKRSIVIGGIVKNTAEILSGVKENESVICTNVSTLQDGDSITIVTK